MPFPINLRRRRSLQMFMVSPYRLKFQLPLYHRIGKTTTAKTRTLKLGKTKALDHFKVLVQEEEEEEAIGVNRERPAAAQGQEEIKDTPEGLQCRDL